MPVGQNFGGKNTLNWALLVQKAAQLLRPVANVAKTRLGRKNRHFGPWELKITHFGSPG
jgi:hypothetical protein